MPSNTIEIGRYAFSDCKSLQCVHIPSTVEVIGDGAFHWCDSLSIVVFEEESELREIKNDAFSYSGLTGIIIPAKVVTIGKNAFHSCNQLSQVAFEYFEDNNECFLKEIGESAFSSCAIQEINLPKSVEIVEDHAFFNCEDLRSVYFASDKLVSFGQKVFLNCSNLSELSILCPVEKFHHGALLDVDAIVHFSSKSIDVDCNLGEEHYLEKVRDWLNACFSYDRVLGVDEERTIIVEFANEGQNLVVYIHHDDNTIEEWKVFDSAAQTWNVEIKYANGRIFKDITRTIPLEFTDDITFVDGDTLNDDTTIIKTIKYTKYADRQLLDKYVGLRICNCKEIGKCFAKYAYGQTTNKILFVEIGRETEKILYGAFQGCNSLLQIVIPSGVKEIGEEAFTHCKFKQILFDNDSALEIIGNSAFCHCGFLEEIEIPSQVNSIGRYAFHECVSLTSVTFLGNNIKKIKESTFGWCESLLNIRIPSSVTIIEENVFQGCYALEKIEIPSNVTRIENSAFCYCDNLQSIVINEGVEEIGHNVFDECESLESIEIPASVEEFKEPFGQSSLTRINFKS
jgi:hypothetical protein